MFWASCLRQCVSKGGVINIHDISLYFTVFNVFSGDGLMLEEIPISTHLKTSLLTTIVYSPAADGAGHCPWGVFADWIVCTIHGDVQFTALMWRAQWRKESYRKYIRMYASVCMHSVCPNSHGSCSRNNLAAVIFSVVSFDLTPTVCQGTIHKDIPLSINLAGKQ